MKVLVIGSGGREHALVWKIAQSSKVEKIFCAPGNAGTADLAENINIKVDDVAALLKFAQEAKIDLTVVGPEVPLVLGLVDEFAKAGLRAFGPIKAAAAIEGSKVFSKKFMVKYDIPTAQAGIFDNAHDAHEYIEQVGSPIVVKADGLAAGKGVIVCQTKGDAHEAVTQIMEKKEFGVAGDQLVIEECLEGEEASIIALTDGETIIPLASSQDHKRIFDNDEGPNTGGMGAYSPAPLVTETLLTEITNVVLKPFVFGMKQEGINYKGVVYAGVMVTKKGPMVLEFNARFGDPETQPILMRMKSDLVPLLDAVIDGRLAGLAIDWHEKAAVCVVLAAKGYPGSYEKGDPIKGLENIQQIADAAVFHAGTSRQAGQVVTSGGRVLGVTALGDTIKFALDKAYQAVKLIKFKGMQYRRDIGKKALKYEK
ncbi:phosphoribosylamine--glycine ligase [candidate division WOR-1 bacterium RIFOXYB2_FULL_48_7]|uniref:Phosphoribosylamine--glycine ligase n=1 Tax=candidate division WOR-1 bacterium RIFOXYB2_FULL_48_7 TaxID=1802583 RepID=A0A1F4TSQ8_UNCSA|nr:MAG: phosphoribosylamine--glycine ligase [candidate division WOR-1 bacterium RIFOXYB2_FULL_48_7]